MKIGIIYDTIEDYENIDTRKYCDFATLSSISFLKKQFELAGYEVELVRSIETLKKKLEHMGLGVDLVYNTVEGVLSRNREAIVPSLLEAYHIPFIGSDAYSISLSLNKYHTKILAEYIGIPTPKAQIIYLSDSEDAIREKISSLRFPLVVKPNYEGSSMGVYRVETIEQCLDSIRKDQVDYRQETLCEEYISGMEITVPIIDVHGETIPLAIIRFHYRDGSDISLFSSHDKNYADVRCEVVSLPLDVQNKVMHYAEQIHKYLGCKDINRIDFRIDSDHGIYFLEMNPLPALDPEGSFVCGAEAAGMSFSHLLSEVVENSYNKYYPPNSN